LHGYLDDELDAAGAVEFERHLETCVECSAALGAERAMRISLASVRLYERAPAGLRSAVHTEIASSLVRSIRAAAPRTKWRWLATAATLLFAVAAGIFAVGLWRKTVPALAVAAVDAHLRSLQPGHLADVQSSDQHTVKPWFDGRIDFAPKVTDFANEGFPLQGGRLDVLNGRTVAALVYGRRKHFINVFVAQPGAGVPSGSGQVQGYHWLAWQSGGLDFIAVTDASAGDLQELRALLERE
jgi:anti-sigma factor RsiW